MISDLITPGEDVAQGWAAAPLSAQREVARRLLSPEVLGEMRITRGRGLPAADRIKRVKGKAA
ncbi:hypothetical protein OG883_28315 [Streptomyces sp. NBC_01142]|uniref:hypothetical protein n=1 Tax=Streptomyces sp. NBC_01142 TaxID=2975865 RepID=UPI0022548084|nr:hypothetical protein [Streptomyces sp. NBC_01142]MCX4823709.1 hypothetical protein [Streptomyces sp. NBC_01142]